MARHFSWIFTLPVTVVVVLFAIANRSAVTLSFWPLPWELDLTVYLVVLGSLFIGFVLGAAVAWLSGSQRRRQSRHLADQVRRQAREIAELQRRQVEAPPAAPAPVVGAEGAGDGRRIPRVSSL